MAKTKLKLDSFIPYRLSVTSNLVSGTIARAYDTLFGLRIPEWRLIAVIAEHDGITQAGIGARTRMDKVTVSRATASLCERGLVARVAHPDDRRSHKLCLTASGRSLYGEVAPKALELEARIFGGFDRAERATLMAMLRRIDGLAIAAEAQAE